MMKAVNAYGQASLCLGWLINFINASFNFGNQILGILNTHPFIEQSTGGIKNNYSGLLLGNLSEILSG